MGIEAKFDPSFEAVSNMGFWDRLRLRLVGEGPQISGFVSQPEPRSIGSFARGKQLVIGNYQFGGHLVQAPGQSLWAIAPPDRLFTIETQGFAWLDDLAAMGDKRARELAQEWTNDWIVTSFGGRGPGWSPDLTGRRIIRWINHALLIMSGQSQEKNDLFFRSLSQQTVFLNRKWVEASPGLPRFEALTGLLYAGLSLGGMEQFIDPALKSLSLECATQITDDGAIPSRNPEELLEIFVLLTWVSDALAASDHPVDTALQAALERIAMTLRTLRHSDGGLACFHGGGCGTEGWLDQALAGVNRNAGARDDLAMGFARLAGGRTSVIIDASDPPQGAASLNAHASTSALELTSGRRPLIVNCGSGASFGSDWMRAGRSSPSHSTLSLPGLSSAKLTPSPEGERLTKGPTEVTSKRSRSVEDAAQLTMSHNGYAPLNGLTHIRKIELSADGRTLSGADSLAALNDEDKLQFDRHMDEISLQGVEFLVRFHLHPDADPKLDLANTAISVTLKSGEVWVFQYSGPAELRLEPSIYLEKGRLRPRATQQIVLSARAMEYATQVSWSLAKAHDTPAFVRDVSGEV